MFVNAGAHYVALDFIAVKEAGGDLGVMAAQVRRAIAWVYKNAASFGGDPERIYIGGHSSGGHLCGVALVTDWHNEFGLPDDAVKGGLCMSGMFDMAPVRLSWRRTYVNFTDAMADAMSSQRHIDKLRAPVVVTYGTFETPDFQRQSRDFAAAVKAAGKPVELIEAPNYAHMEMAESLGNPYGAERPRGARADEAHSAAGGSASTIGGKVSSMISGRRTNAVAVTTTASTTATSASPALTRAQKPLIPTLMVRITPREAARRWRQTLRSIILRGSHR